MTMSGALDLLNTNINKEYMESGKYTNSKGIPVPRVTSIISSMLHTDALLYWANNLGFKGIRYKDAIRKAADIGTEAHFRIECFLKDKLKCDDNIPYLGFAMWYDNITGNGNTIELVASERTVVCDYFGGTFDALLRINGAYYLIDFKTSNHVSYKYFLQLAAYKYMLELEGTYLQGVIVLQLDKEEVGFNEYLLDFSIPNHRDFMNACTEGFFSLVYAYYRTKEEEARYNNIF